MAYNQPNNPFKKLSGNQTPIDPHDGESGGEFDGMTREEAKKTIKFNTSNQIEVKRKKAFYKKYGTLNK